MPTLIELLNNVPTFNYRTGKGNFIANKLDYPGKKPYIVRKPGQTWSPGNFDDGMVGGGIITNISRTAADVLRIGKFFTDLPKGPAFLLKQTSLQLMNPQLEHAENRVVNAPTKGQGFFTNIGNTISNTVNRIVNDIGPTRIYNPLGTNTLAQVGVSAFGGHLVRHGVVPIMQDQDKYESIVTNKNNQGLNRLVMLLRDLSTRDNSNLKDPLFSYKGGAGSFLGIGKTNVKRESTSINDITDNANIESSLRGFIPIPIKELGRITKHSIIGVETGQQILIPGDEFGRSTPELIDFDFSKRDFREYKNDSLKSSINNSIRLMSSDYQNLNLNNRIGTARSRDKNNNEFLYDYTLNAPDASDRINKLSLFYATNNLTVNDIIDVNGNPVIPAGQPNSNLRDMIKFRIKSIDNDNPLYGTYMVFRAFLNSFNDKSDAKFTQYNYLGRGENFYVYDMYNASYNIEFMVVAFSRSEMKPLYQKMNYLKSNLAPDYKGTKMRSPMVELTVGDWLKYQPGFITSLNISIESDFNWEITLTEPDVQSSSTGKKDRISDEEMHELPMMMRVTMNFIPVYNFLPRRSAESPFIGIDDREASGKIINSDKNWISGINSRLKQKDGSNNTSISSNKKPKTFIQTDIIGQGEFGDDSGNFVPLDATRANPETWNQNGIKLTGKNWYD